MEASYGIYFRTIFLARISPFLTGGAETKSDAVQVFFFSRFLERFIVHFFSIEIAVKLHRGGSVDRLY